MKTFFRFFLLVFFFFYILKTSVFAESSYVLPYPSSMPGSFAYRFHLVYENISKYWYFGSFGQFEYNLKLADKYLVEAKTLFDYKQYLLAVESLGKSNYYFRKSLPSLKKAEKEGKSISQKRLVLKEAAQKHVETLEEMQIGSPEIFNWQPEKASPTMLNIKGTIENAINVRKNDL